MGSGVDVVIASECALPTPAVTVNVLAFETNWPGFITVTVTVAGLAINPAGTTAVRFVMLVNVVLRKVPFHCTCEPSPGRADKEPGGAAGTKPDPSIVNLRSGFPAVAELGFRSRMTGRAVIWAPDLAVRTKRMEPQTRTAQPF